MVADALPHAAVTLALRQLLPTPGQTLLLRAALAADHGAEAWATWRAGHDLQATLIDDHVGIKGLLPLLAYSLERNGAAVATEELSLLRMARYREVLRGERYQAILQQTLNALAAGGVRAILLKGAALANRTYPEAALRHCHDIDLLLHPHDLTQAAKLLLAQAFHAAPGEGSDVKAAGRNGLRLYHASGLPVELHTRLFRHNHYGLSLDDAWQNALPYGDAPSVMMLAPEWELVHIVGVMLCAPGRARLTWVCDVHFLLAAHAEIDWERVCEIATQSCLAMAICAIFEYLHDQLGEPIPLAVIETLRSSSAQADRAAVEQLLHCARRQEAARYSDLLSAASTWQERLFLLRWMLLPLPTAEQRYQAACLPLLLFYLRRGLRYLARQLFSTKTTKDQA
jgi:hypothetical protein